MRRWTGRSFLLTIALCLLTLLPVQAQQNLLQNPDFENDYSGRMGRGDFNFPAGWDGWWTDAPHTETWMNVAPTGYPHGGPFRRGGANAQSIAKGSGTFTAAALQIVPNIPPGAVLQGSAWIYIENSEGTNAQVRIGIGSNVGTNVYGNITWSDWSKSLNNLHQISVNHVATGGDVTLVIYATQTWPNDPNAVYFDDAELFIIGEGEVPADNSNSPGVVAAPTTQPRDSGVAFVSPQDSGDDGSITHTVRSGDTLASISVAYGVRVTEILDLNGLDRSSLLQVGQDLVIATPDPDFIPQETDEPEATEDASTLDEPQSTEDPEATDEPESTDEPEATSEAGVEITAEVLGAVITEFTATPDISPTPSNTPTETPIPDTATPAPTAPVASADTEDFNPIGLEPGICIGMFDDGNQNGVFEPGLAEAYLAEGVISIMDSTGETVETYTTDGDSEPVCIEELEAGRYEVVGTAPDDYGLTTSPILRVNLEDGATIRVLFGAKQGLEVLAIPTVPPSPTDVPPETGAVGDSEADLTDYSGLIVFGVAGVVLVVGLGTSLFMRGR